MANNKAWEGCYFPIDAMFYGKNGVNLKINPARAFTDEATLKSLFYLDGFVAYTAKDASGNTYHGFWGILNNDPNSFNYKHHNPARMLAEVIPGKLLLNDAGLNTRPDVVAQTVQDASITNATIRINGLSAYHLRTDKTGVEYRIWTNGVWSAWHQADDITPFPRATSYTVDIRLIHINAFTADAGSLVEFRGWVENDEGRFTSFTTDNFDITLAPVNLRPNQSSNPVQTYYTQAPGMYTVDEVGVTGATRLYRLVNGAYQMADAGNYYHETDNNLYYTFGSHVDYPDGSNILLSLTNTTPIPPSYSTVQWVSYGDDTFSACRKVGVSGNSVVTYRSLAQDGTNGKHYPTPSFSEQTSVYASNGYYTRETPGGDHELIYINQGVESLPIDTCEVLYG